LCAFRIGSGPDEYIGQQVTDFRFLTGQQPRLGFHGRNGGPETHERLRELAAHGPAAQGRQRTLDWPPCISYFKNTLLKQERMHMSNAEIFRTYLQRFTAGDREGAGELLTDDFRFHGPILQSEGKTAFLEGSAQMAPIMRGADIHHQWEDGDEVFSVYEFKIETPAGAGSIPMAEWNTVRDGKLASARLMFDTAAMAALMPAGA
jgi:ketosteroid isomerase-like protein